jgi:hypothetical protein
MLYAFEGNNSYLYEVSKDIYKIGFTLREKWTGFKRYSRWNIHEGHCEIGG